MLCYLFLSVAKTCHSASSTTYFTYFITWSFHLSISRSIGFFPTALPPCTKYVYIYISEPTFRHVWVIQKSCFFFISSTMFGFCYASFISKFFLILHSLVFTSIPDPKIDLRIFSQTFKGYSLTI